MTGLGTCLVVVIIRNLVKIRESPALLAGPSLASHARNESTAQHTEGATATKVLGGGVSFLVADRGESFLIKEGFAEVDVIGPCLIVDVWVGGGVNNAVTVYFLVQIRVNDKAEFGNNFISGIASEISIVERIGAIILDVLRSLCGQRSGFPDAGFDVIITISAGG